MSRSAAIAQGVFAGAVVLAVLGAATAGLAVELVRRCIVRVWGGA